MKIKKAIQAWWNESLNLFLHPVLKYPRNFNARSNA